VSPDMAGNDDAPSTVKLSLPESQVQDLFSAYYQSWLDNGTPPPHTPILNGYFSSTEGKMLASLGQDTISQGVRHHAYWHPSGPVWAFGVSTSPSGTIGVGYVDKTNPYLMLCFSLSATNLYTPTDLSKPIVQPPSENTFGAGLAPGTYSKVVVDTLHSTCAITDGSHYMVFGYGDLPYAASGAKSD
jgi:hypothetical protein